MHNVTPDELRPANNVQYFENGSILPLPSSYGGALEWKRRERAQLHHPRFQSQGTGKSLLLMCIRSDPHSL